MPGFQKKEKRERHDIHGNVLSAEQQEQMEITRIRIPEPPQTIGIVMKRVGGSRMIVKCMDGKERNCKIPGRMKRFLWVRENDIVIVEPWEFTPDEKGDVIFKYTKTQVNHLKLRGLIKFDQIEEF